MLPWYLPCPKSSWASFWASNKQNARKIPKKASKRYIKRRNKMIIAVDFDGVLCRNAFPDIGKPNYTIISLIRQLIDRGDEVILWTSRVDTELEAAIDWCGDRGLHFSAINDNAPSNIAEYKLKYPNGTRKVYADVYIDDHDLMFYEVNEIIMIYRIEDKLRRLLRHA